MLRETAVFASHGSAVSCEFVLADNLWLEKMDKGNYWHKGAPALGNSYFPHQLSR